jgi:hypothetical protein
VPNNSTESDSGCEDFVFGANEVYSVNIVMSTGSGQCTPSKVHGQPMILQRDIGRIKPLRIQAARTALTESSRVFGAFPFS